MANQKPKIQIKLTTNVNRMVIGYRKWWGGGSKWWSGGVVARSGGVVAESGGVVTESGEKVVKWW
jgi:hypothetical protein